MLGDLLFLFCLISGSFSASLFFKRKFEEVLPLIIMSIVIIEYLFGIFNFLLLGFYFCCTIFGLCTLWLILKLVKKEIYMESMIRFLFTPSFVLFVLIFFLLLYFNYGKLATYIDEFSHWMECIKSMIYLDDFSTNPLSHDDYASYPPGMALFQYFVQKLYLISSQEKNFCEWRMNFAYQIFSIALVFPFFSKVGWKNWQYLVSGMFFFVISPCIFYESILKTVEIDPFVAIMAGCGITIAEFVAEKDLYSLIYLTLLCCNLFLAKDVGLMFAIFILIIYLVKVVIISKGSVCEFSGIKKYLYGIIPITSLIIIKLTWNHELKVNNVKINNVKEFRIREFFELLILHNGTTFRQEVVNNFVDAFSNKNKQFFSFADGLVRITYLELTVFMALVIMIFVLFHKDKIFYLFSGVMILLLIILYILGLGVLYASGSEWPSLRLLSYSRYINIVYLAVWIVGLFVLFQFIIKNEKRKYRMAFGMFFSLFIFLLSSRSALNDFITKQTVKDSIEYRSQYEELSNKIIAACNEGDKVYFVSKGLEGENSGAHGGHYNIVKFNAEPITVSIKDNGWDGWGVGPALSDDDIWFMDVTPEEWMQILRDDGYTHVAIFRKGNVFENCFSIMFESCEDIKDNELYKIDFAKNKLIVED